MNLFSSNDNFIKSKRLFYPECPNHADLMCGKLITKNKIKTGLKKLEKGIKKFQNIKNDLGRKALHAAANNDTISSMIESVPVMGDTLSSVIKLGDKAVQKADQVADKIKKKQYSKEDFKKDINEMKEDKDFQKLKNKISNWYNEHVKTNDKLTTEEKGEIKENLESLNLEEAAKLGDKAPLAGLLTSRKSKTLKSKYRKALGISQKTLKNNGRLFLASGKSGTIITPSGGTINDVLPMNTIKPSIKKAGSAKSQVKTRDAELYNILFG